MTQCFTPTISKSGASYRAEKSDKMDSAQAKHMRTLLLPAHLTGLTHIAFRALKRDNSSARGAVKAYRESQSRIYKLEAPMYLGIGEGIDSLDFHADLSALKAIDPDESQDRPSVDSPVPRSDSPLLQKLKQGETTYAYCAWCTAALPTRHKLEEHYFSAHEVVLQPSCCAPPSVFQTIMGKELQLRQNNFASFSVRKLLLRPQMDPDEARDIIGATCSMTEDKVRVWHVRMPDFQQATHEMPDIVVPDLHWLDDEEADLNDYLKDPTHPVVCLPGKDHRLYWGIRVQCHERHAWRTGIYSELLAAFSAFAASNTRDEDAVHSSNSFLCQMQKV